MSSVRSVLTGLKARQLKQLCVNCGVAQTGNKPALVDRLVLAPRRPIPNKLLSIDMGVKNLACCELSVEDNVETVKKWWLVEVPETKTFEQPYFAQLALDIVDSLCLPSVILIEQQRMRSQGLSNVPEWISRVNLLEAMIHALIQRQVRHDGRHIDVYSIAPAKVMNYWIRGDEVEKHANDSNKRYRVTKRSKVDLVDRWLADQTQSVFQMDPSITVQNKKRDDLSDALLQALSWVRWQRNLETLDEVLGMGDAERLKSLELLDHKV